MREHPHVGWLLAHSAADGPLVLGAHGTRYLDDDRIDGADPLAHFSPNAAGHLRRTDGFANAPDLLVGSFYDPSLEEGCAFEELISFHGGLGGRRRVRSSCTPRPCRCPTSRSSARRPSTTCSRAGASS